MPQTYCLHFECGTDLGPRLQLSRTGTRQCLNCLCVVSTAALFGAPRLTLSCLSRNSVDLWPTLPPRRHRGSTSKYGCLLRTGAAVLPPLVTEVTPAASTTPTCGVRSQSVSEASAGRKAPTRIMADPIFAGLDKMAVASTDAGHTGVTADGTWAIAGPETQIDFGWRAVHLTATYSKQIVKVSVLHQCGRTFARF